jgi:integrase
MATINKRRLRSGKVVWEITHGTGADRRRFVAGQTREEAQQVLLQFERQLALHGEAPGDDSVNAVLGSYISFLKANRRPGTFRRYVRVLKTFRECFLAVHHPEIERLRHVKPVHIEEYKTRRADGSLREADGPDDRRRELELRQQAALNPKAAARRDNAKFGWLGRKRFRPSITQRTINYELQVLRTFFRWAVGRNHTLANPVSAVERFRVPKRALPKFLTTEQLRRLFAACDEQDRRLFMTILLTGMRKGEVEHLTWADVNLDLNVILIQEKADVGWKPKTDERIIPISPVLREILLLQFQQRRSDGLVFANRAGSRDTHILEKFKHACRRASIPATTVHALRHSFGAHLRMAGVSLADIADLLGHKDLATTQIYAKVHQEHLRAAIAKLNTVVGRDAPGGDADALSPADPSIPIRGLLKD